MPILVVLAMMDVSPNKKTLLQISGGLDRYRFQAFNALYGTSITFLNSKKFGIYEKFQRPQGFDYDSVTVQQLENDIDRKYDFILGWSQDVENPFLGIDVFVDRLSDGGVMVIQNTSDSVFLYQNDTQASPVWTYHQDLKSRQDCNVYHIPLFYGITVVVKRPK